MRKKATLWLLLVMCLSGVAFTQTSAKDPDTLARQVLAALAAKDEAALKSLSINQAEIKNYIWPTVASRVSGGGHNAEKFSSMYSKSSELAITERLTENGGKKFDLVKVSTDPAKQYRDYRLLPNPEITVRSEGGQERTIKLGSALLERDGGLLGSRATTVHRPVNNSKGF